MKKITYFKTLLVAIALIVGNISASAQLLVEDFNYTVGDNLTAHGWNIHSGSSNPMLVSASSISYSGYISSGIGGEVALTTSGDDYNIAFASQTTGSLYAAFLVNVTAATTTGDYFAHFAQTSGTTNVTVFGARLWAKKDANNNLAFGISKTSTSGNVSYTGFNYTLGTTYLVVIKYNFVSGTANDTEDLFINPVIGSPEPTPTISTTTADNAGTDLTAIVSFCLRQGSSNAAPNVKVDGIRVGTAWSDVVAAPAAPSITTTAAGNITTSSADFNGNITSDGGSAITERGFYWSRISPVTTSNIQAVASGTAVGAYSTNLDTLAANTHYYVKAYATNAIGSTLSSTEVDFYTLAFVPNAPTVNNATPSSLDVKPEANPTNNANLNPQYTAVAIQETGSGNYVQANGSLDVAAVWQTPADWGTKTVTGLSANTSYTFKVKAINGASVETALGAAATLSTSIGTSLKQVSITNLRIIDGSINFESVAGRSVEIYNSVGQRLISTKSVEGLNSIPVAARGVVFVKVDGNVSKIIL
jgi:hypothetical protein